VEEADERCSPNKIPVVVVESVLVSTLYVNQDGSKLTIDRLDKREEHNNKLLLSLTLHTHLSNPVFPMFSSHRDPTAEGVACCAFYMYEDRAEKLQSCCFHTVSINWQ